jgi:putative FmdB family regulatory protein
MPIYEYKCKECDHRLEKIQKMSDDPLKDCPSCEKPALSKVVSASSFKLKGTGWYETDFKGGSKKSESKTETTSSSKD